jgi:hypothetical protein
MTISQVWEYAATDVIYSGSVGDANFMTNKNTVLITYGNTSYIGGVPPSPYAPGAQMDRIREVTHDPVPEVVFDLALFDFTNTSSNNRGTSGYRAVRIPDLYSVQPQPVTDLLISSVTNEFCHLQFSGDVSRTYTVQASTNLVDWDDIGQATPSANANFDFVDSDSPGYSIRYYRVVTN